MKIFITGGEGFIGSAVIQALLKRFKCRILSFGNHDRVSERFNAVKNKIDVVKANILNKGRIEKTLLKFKPDIVIHLAAIAGVDTTSKDPVNTLNVNLTGTTNMLESTIKCNINVERFIFFSTSEVFGRYAYWVEETGTTNLLPVGTSRAIYSFSKLSGEHLCYAYYHKYGLNYVVLRPFNVYGPGQVGEGAVHTFIKNALVNKPLKIHGDGTQIRAWCYLDDMVDAVLLSIKENKALGHIFNIPFLTKGKSSLS